MNFKKYAQNMKFSKFTLRLFVVKTSWWRILDTILLSGALSFRCPSTLKKLSMFLITLLFSINILLYDTCVINMLLIMNNKVMPDHFICHSFPMIMVCVPSSVNTQKSHYDRFYNTIFWGNHSSFIVFIYYKLNNKH